ncbi:MAG TPA: hypothetical protein VF401_00780 [Candidatus Saccharimonadales bacterium]
MNELKHIDEFKAVLANYRPSTASLNTLSQTRLVLLVAPTSSGRNTAIREIMKTGDYYFVISDTTRLPRENDGIMEQDGVEYWFRSEADMLADIKKGAFLEAAVIHEQQVSGISIRELQKATELQKIAITDAEIAGVVNTIKYKPDTLAIFMVPPSFDEWQRRLKHRGEMPPVEYRRRMESAILEFEAALSNDCYKFVINDTVEHAAEQVNRLAKLNEIDQDLQSQARDKAQQLLLATRELVRSLSN